jgi:hypothetical protein
VIDLETRLLEILDWDEEKLSLVYDRAAKFLQNCRLSDKSTIERMLVNDLKKHISEEGARIVFSILDQNIRREMRIIEE